jgi:hypothetical protein
MPLSNKPLKCKDYQPLVNSLRILETEPALTQVRNLSRTDLYSLLLVGLSHADMAHKGRV